MNWAQLGLSTIPEGQYRGLRVLDLSGLVDKTNNITFEHPGCRNDESYFDVVEDPSDKKRTGKLLCHLANMCSNNQGQIFCY
jgi:hypothetical protein